MCGQHNVRAYAEDNTGQNRKDTHPIPGQKLKFLTPPGWKAGTLPTTPRRQIKPYFANVKIVLVKFTFSQKLFII